MQELLQREGISGERANFAISPLRLEKTACNSSDFEFLSLDCSAAQGEWHSDSEIKNIKTSYVICNCEATKEFWDGAICSEKKPHVFKATTFTVRKQCGKNLSVGDIEDGKAQ